MDNGCNMDYRTSRVCSHFVDDVCELVIQRMGGFDKCDEFFTTARTNELYEFAAQQYQSGATVGKAARRYLAWYPAVQHFLKTGELELPPMFDSKPIHTTPSRELAPYEIARQKRRALWETARYDRYKV